MIEAEVSMLQSQPRAKGYYNVIGDPELLDDVLGEWVRDGKMMIVDGKREYYGQVKGQVIGIEPRTDTDSIIPTD